MKKEPDESFEVLPEIKSRLKFQNHNLFKNFDRREKFDLVLIRNVLIYFTASDQEKVVSLINPKIAEDGTLIIGESESLTHINTNFKAIEPLVYQQKSSFIASLKAS